jgi:hypothetical protein
LAVEIALTALKESTSHKEEETFRFYKESDCVSISNNEINSPLYIKCLSNSSTMPHVFSKHNLFIDYQPLDGVSIGEVGMEKTHTHGKGTIKLIVKHDNCICTIMLHNVLYVPECKYNLISLKRWKDTERSYYAKNGMLMLYSTKEIPIIQGKHTSNNLNFSNISWKTWNRQFSHIGYNSLQNLKKNNIVQGFKLDLKSLKLDCILYAATKLTHKPFHATMTYITKLEQLTHINL